MSFDATGTATDPFDLTDSDTVTINAGGTTGQRTIRVSFFENRVVYGNPVDDTVEGPDLITPDPYLQQRPLGPVTIGHTYTMARDCRIPGFRIYKHPESSGSIQCVMWNDSGTVLASKTVTWVADSGGYRTILFDAPVNVTANETYNFGYYYAATDDNYAVSQWVWNGGQDTFVYPFNLKTFSSGGAGNTGGSWNKQGVGLTFSADPLNRQPANYYIDPIAEWETDLPAYTGPTYWDQWDNGPDFSTQVPIAVWWVNGDRMPEYADIGINTLIGGFVDGTYEEFVKASGMNWWPFLHGGDMNGPVVVQEDPDLAAQIQGYFITDEPDVIRPFESPAAVREWRNQARSLDSTRPMWLNLSRYAFENQGFTWQPTGITPKNANLQWREYVTLTDVATVDAYSINANYPYNLNISPDAHNRWGIWTYPHQIDWAKKMAEGRCPAWGVVETASSMPGLPLPAEVKKATWALLIGGATGIEYFQHRFADSDQPNDFASLVNNPEMSAAVLELNTQIQSLAGPILSPEASLVEEVISSNTTNGPVGGIYGVPIHQTSRLSGGSSYIFAQSIRPGTTTGTFYVPSLAGATLTVIGEGRTVVIDGDGHFSDTFTSDYAYHLYSTTADPVYTAPTNSVAPILSTDGTPQTGETITSGSGTWTGVPSPTFTYQWQRDSSDISGATTPSYTLQVADETHSIRCRVSATNVAGTASANSDAITADAASGGGGEANTDYFDAVTALNPIAYWRLSDFTEENGAFPLTPSVTPPINAASLLNDGGGSKKFTNDTTQTLSRAHNTALNLKTGGWSIAGWLSLDFITTFNAIHKEGHYRVKVTGGGNVDAFVYTTNGDFWRATSTTALSIGDSRHFVLTWDASVLKLYIDGTLEATVDTTPGTDTPNTTASPFCFGKDLGSGLGGWFGSIDEVAIFNTTLSDADAIALFEAGIS